MVITTTLESRPMMTMTTRSSMREKPRSHARERAPVKMGAQGGAAIPSRPRLLPSQEHDIECGRENNLTAPA